MCPLFVAAHSPDGWVFAWPNHSHTAHWKRLKCECQVSSQSPGEIKRREVSWTLTKKLDSFASPGEIKRREVVLDPRVSPEEIKSREVELGLRVGLLLLQLFLNGGATDIIFVTRFCVAVGAAIAWYGGRCAMPDGHCRNILLFWRRSTVALVFRVGACFEVSLFCPLFPTRPRP